MPRKEKYDPNRLSSLGVWLRKSDSGLPRADQTTYEAAELGLLADELRILKQVEAEALVLKSDLEENSKLLASHPNAGKVEELLRKKAEARDREIRTRVQQAGKMYDIGKIDMALRAFPDLHDIARLMDQRDILQRAFDERKELALKIYPQLNKDWPPLKTAKKKT